MAYLKDAQQLAQLIASSTSRAALREALAAVSRAMRFRFFALTYHPRRGIKDIGDLRDHNYPYEWEESYDRRQLGLSDPIHRASNLQAAGFRWQDAPAIIPYTERDLAMIDEARRFGIEDGFTVPTNVPGERPGSVSFVTGNGDIFPEDMLLFAEGFGHMAFQRIRMIEGQRPVARKLVVTDRHLEIVVLIGRDKTNGEIGELLGIKEDTVMKHVATICARFDALRRTSLPMRAVLGGLLTFSDILP